MQTRTFNKIMAANRGEIAIRIFRACTELGIRTLAVYSREDQLSIHRYKADEAFRLGHGGDPVGAYLDQDTILAIAKERGVDAIHPGYGFLSENAEFARRCAQAGITFIGPQPEVLEIFGNKVASRKLAISAEVPVVPGTDDPVTSADQVRAFAAQHGYPVLLKAAFGGGGRGMRVIRSADEVDVAFARASSEAAAAFGHGAVFCERLVENAKHIEVQLLADNYGARVHLFERDCSIQRRHQKVIEIAPAVSLGDMVRQELYQASLRLAQAANYSNAGTVEFLVEPDGNFYFIEVNPRIQVEHTVTEMITGRDLVQAQIQIAQGHRLSDPEVGISSQASVSRRGYAVQSRLTTEDPERGFIPDTGKLIAYRSAAGFGIRLDAGTAGAGSVITSDYDTLIVKVTSWALEFKAAVDKAVRSLREFRIRGVKTNIPFLENVLQHPDFRNGRATTMFVDNHPDLLVSPRRRDRATKLLRALASAVLNGPPGMDSPVARPQPLITPRVPESPADAPADSPAMAVFRAEGAAGLSRWMYAQKRLLITDTTLRDAHQSLLATRVRTADMLAIAPTTARLLPQLFSLEMWGGATFDVSYRFLREDPWERAERLRAAVPNVLLQMLLRGANAVGYTNYPDNVVRAFVREAAAVGIDIFRIFDALNWIPNMALAMEEVASAGKIVEASICYTADIDDPTRAKYHLDYYLDIARKLADHGAHILAIKDMAGLLKPQAAPRLIQALRAETGLPVHLHTHDTSGNGIATYMMATEAGVDCVDCALSSMSGLTSQPSLNSLLAVLQGHERRPELDSHAAQRLADYWERVRDLYYPFESGLKASTADVYVHEIPGGQYSNLRPRAIKLGLGDRWNDIKARFREVNFALGDIVKVTPTSKVVADFAMFLVQNDLTVEQAVARAESLDFPASLIDFLSGHLGQPHGGFPEDLQRAVLQGAPALTERAGASLPDHDFDAAAARLSERLSRSPGPRELVSDALYPKVFEEYQEFCNTFGDVSRLPTPAFLYGLQIGEEVSVDIEPGKTLVVKLTAIGELSLTGLRTVHFDLNGQPRAVQVRDHSIEAKVAARPKADRHDPKQIGASMPGKVLSVTCAVGDQVAARTTLLVVEAMKMETVITPGVAGDVAEVHVTEGDTVAAGDLLVTLR